MFLKSLGICIIPWFINISLEAKTVGQNWMNNMNMNRVPPLYGYVLNSPTMPDMDNINIEMPVPPNPNIPTIPGMNIPEIPDMSLVLTHARTQE